MELLREASDALFAAPFKLEIILAVADLEGTRFSTGMIHKALQEASEDVRAVPDKSTVGRTLGKLAAAGLLDAEPNRGRGHYKRRESAVWELAERFGAEVEARHRPRPLGLAVSGGTPAPA